MRNVYQAIAALRARLAHLARAKAPGCLLRVQEAAPDFVAPAWLAAQSCYPQLLWRDRRGDAELALLGQLVERRPDAASLPGALSELLAALADAAAPDGGELRCYGGMAFSDASDVWSEFGYSRWLVPLIERGRSRRDCWLACHLDGRSDQAWQDSLRRADETLAGLSGDAARLVLPSEPYTCVQRPEYPLWQQRVEQALAEFDHSALDKVVLARQTELRFAAPVDPWALLERWQACLPQSYQFGFVFAPGEAFIGCSPEQLFRRIDRMIYTEALAGSCARGLTPREDHARAESLLGDAKNRWENRLVLDSIQQQLASSVEYLDLEGRLEVLKLARIQHLRHRLRGLLRPGVDDPRLLQQLHPTPAVGGYPRDAAQAWIAAAEQEKRGWYAGVVAALGQRESQAVVAIRSARVQGERLTLYAGAGIVPGSEPLNEWLELDHKIATVMSLFQRACA